MAFLLHSCTLEASLCGRTLRTALAATCARFQPNLNVSRCLSVPPVSQNESNESKVAEKVSDEVDIAASPSHATEKGHDEVALAEKATAALPPLKKYSGNPPRTIFAKIIDREIPSTIVHEDDKVLGM